MMNDQIITYAYIAIEIGKLNAKTYKHWS